MKQKILLPQLAGYSITVFLGTLLHFLYEASGGHPAAALISGVNESTWEHMKLLFFPAFFWAGLQSRFFKRRDFWQIKLYGIALGLALIPVLFYLYNGAVGRSPDFVNIGIFFVAAAGEFLLEGRLFGREEMPVLKNALALTLLFALAGLFFLFTFRPPAILLFRDPISGVYGIEKFLPYNL